MLDLPCPCCSGVAYARCCLLFIEGQALPSTPEALMRSRYTAYSQANMNYIEQTMQGKAVSGFDFDNAQVWAQSVQWLRLQVIRSSENHVEGQVEFLAEYQEAEESRCIHENSLFHRLNGRWYYVDALPLPKCGRNDPCDCGSGKKFKQCCR